MPESAAAGFANLFAAAEKNQAELYLLPSGGPNTREYRNEQRFAAEWEKTPSGFVIKNAAPIFANLRLRKSEMELRLLQHAIDITIEAQERAWSVAGNAKWEYEVDAQVVYTFKLRNADHWGYPSIVGCGPNATTLHYIESQGAVSPGQLILMDVGAEYEHYTADVTRTFPVSGKFTPRSGRGLSNCFRRAGGGRESDPSGRHLFRRASRGHRSNQERACSSSVSLPIAIQSSTVFGLCMAPLTGWE